MLPKSSTNNSTACSPWVLRESIPPQVRLLWTLRRSPVYLPLSTNIAREVCHYLRESKVLVSFAEDKLRVYTSPEHCTVPRDIADSFRGAIFSQVSGTEVLCVGTYPTSSSVSSVDTCTLSIRREEPMHESRNCPGVLRVEGFVYVFGGYANGYEAASCEKFCVSSRVWKSLPDMNRPRAYFSPALHQRDIVLVDPTQDQHDIARFHLDTETYSISSVSFPDTFGSGVSFILEDVLVILSGNQIANWDIGSETLSIQNIASEGYNGFSCTEVIVSNDCVCWLDYLLRKPVVLDLTHSKITIHK